jgi:hypothetical protein
MRRKQANCPTETHWVEWVGVDTGIQQTVDGNEMV